MGPEQKAHFQRILRTWRQQLEAEINRTVDEMQRNADSFADPNDRATQTEDFNLQLRTRDRERRLVAKIDKTLERMERDDYGYCDNCGVEIGIRRLEARPTASLCIECKTLDELKERHQNRSD